MTSGVKTSPLSRNAWSFSSALSASSSAPGVFGNVLRLFRSERVDVLVERLARVDLVLDAVEAGHQHGRERQVRVAVGSGQRNSSRLAFGELPPIGMRIDAERLRDEYARLTGAS